MHLTILRITSNIIGYALHIQKLEDHGRDITMPQHNVIADIDRAEDVRDLPADAAMKAFPILLKYSRRGFVCGRQATAMILLVDNNARGSGNPAG
jgi:predicted acetyltransferase